MQTKVDLGFYLKTIYPQKIKGFSKEYFLDDLLCLLIENKGITYKYNESYLFSRELTSRLFNNKADMPKTIQEKIDDDVFRDKNMSKMPQKFSIKLLDALIFIQLVIHYSYL